jgi:hypothetical protein
VCGFPDEYEALWQIWQKRLALLSTSSLLVRADHSFHAIQFDAPDLTAEALRLVIAAARAKRALPACSATRLPQLSGTCLDPSKP